MSIPQSGGGPIEHHAQLAEYLSSGCKPREDWRIGTEHEKFGYCKDTLNPLPYDGPRSILAVLEGLRDLPELRRGAGPRRALLLRGNDPAARRSGRLSSDQPAASSA